jgi:hypothetical protein
VWKKFTPTAKGGMMTTEFEKFWENQLEVSFSSATALDAKLYAEEIWHAAQRALLRTIENPPQIPKTGDKIRPLSLWHPAGMYKTHEVTGVTEGLLKVYWINTKHQQDGGELHSSGILGEVEIQQCQRSEGTVVESGAKPGCRPA